VIIVCRVAASRESLCQAGVASYSPWGDAESGPLVADVLVWVMQRRVVPADRAERLRKELAEIDAEVARLEAAAVVFGQFADAPRAATADDPVMAEEFERVTTSPGAGGILLLLPPRRPRC
jgi:hypothetical protein